MKVLRLVEAGRDLEAQHLPEPEVGPEEVLVEIKAAGICRSDMHYRAGTRPVPRLPLTPGHEIAGVVRRTGADVSAITSGDRVCIHYLVTCGNCEQCRRGGEQFCISGEMVGLDRDGGYAELVGVPGRNVLPLPEAVSFEAGAVLMCSSATAFHALRRGRLRPGESVAVFGVGGLGMSAVQLAAAFGALDVFAVDIEPGKLATAASYGAVPIDAREGDPGEQIRRVTGGRGVDVALDLVGSPETMRSVIDALAVSGRAVAVAVTQRPVGVDPFWDLVQREAEVVGSADHLASELPTLIELARRGTLDLSRVVTRTVPLEVAAVNEALDRLAAFGSDVRTVIIP